jgi:uncharacterized membrane protein YhaH (DUF805 family)
VVDSSGWGSILRSLLRREAILGAVELGAATLLLHLFAREPAQVVSAVLLFLAGLFVTAWLGRRRLADRSRATRFLALPLVARALGWAVAAVPFSGTAWSVTFFAAYFGFLVGGLRGVVYRGALDA